jgi:hypothetical protein
MDSILEITGFNSPTTTNINKLTIALRQGNTRVDPSISHCPTAPSSDEVKYEAILNFQKLTMARRYHITTFGCQMNKADLERG